MRGVGNPSGLGLGSKEARMAHQHHHVPPSISAIALITFAVLLPIAALIFGVLAIGFFSSR